MNNKVLSLCFSAAMLLLGGYFLFFYDQGDTQSANKDTAEYATACGPIFGTIYNVKYQHPKQADLGEQILKTLQNVDRTLSMFNPRSQLSALNSNLTDTVSPEFIRLYGCAHDVWENTAHAFDITVAPLVDIWGFGKEERREVSDEDIQRLLPSVGMDKIQLNGNRLTKSAPNIRIDASAIAKGFAVDEVANMLRNDGCKNFIVEIGGEIVAEGVNEKGEPWHVGINTPDDDPDNTSNDVQRIVNLTNAALATSGNYRRYYEVNGKRYGHTIDPRTGYPAQTEVLSATVIASNCAKADAYATAFMVLGVDKALEICQNDSSMQCLLIVKKQGKDGYDIITSKNFQK